MFIYIIYIYIYVYTYYVCDFVTYVCMRMCCSVFHMTSKLVLLISSVYQ